MALPKKTVAPPAEGLNFGRLDFYAGGGGLPEGDYVWTDVTVQMHDGFGEKKGVPRLGVMITLKNLADLEADDRKQFYSFGTAADKSFAPNPETGKGVVAIPGGTQHTFNNTTNWAFLLKSLYDAGLPPGTFENDTTVLEGIHVHMQNIPEPAERAGFTAKTGDAAEERKPGQIAIVTEIKEDGKPWEGTGGIPETTAKPVAKKGPVAVKTAAKVAPKLAAQEAAELDEDDMKSAAISGLTDALTASPNGGAKLPIKMAAFKALKKSYGDEVAQAVQDGMYQNDEILGGLLGELGYALAGAMVKVAA